MDEMDEFTVTFAKDIVSDIQEVTVHSKKKSTSEHPFWCSRLSQVEDSVQYLEGPNSTWN